jgi:Flp pilus assembly protein TadG
MWPDERGQSLVEMALVLPLLLLLLAGIIDFGRAFNNYIIITNAAREGARAASHFPDNPVRIKATVRQEAADSGLDPDAIRITIVPECCALAGERIEVSAEYDFDTILGSIIGVPSLTLHSSTRMVVFGLDS